MGLGAETLQAESTYRPGKELVDLTRSAELTKVQGLSQRVQSTYMVQSMTSVVVISLMVWGSIPHMGT